MRSRVKLTSRQRPVLASTNENPLWAIIPDPDEFKRDFRAFVTLSETAYGPGKIWNFDYLDPFGYY